LDIQAACLQLIYSTAEGKKEEKDIQEVDWHHHRLDWTELRGAQRRVHD